MIAHLYLRTRDLALVGHISIQQVRNYEASGLIPKAQRKLPTLMMLRKGISKKKVLLKPDNRKSFSLTDHEKS